MSAGTGYLKKLCNLRPWKFSRGMPTCLINAPEFSVKLCSHTHVNMCPFGAKLFLMGAVQFRVAPALLCPPEAVKGSSMFPQVPAQGWQGAQELFPISTGEGQAVLTAARTAASQPHADQIRIQSAHSQESCPGTAASQSQSDQANYSQSMSTHVVLCSN